METVTLTVDEARKLVDQLPEWAEKLAEALDRAQADASLSTESPPARGVVEISVVTDA